MEIRGKRRLAPVERDETEILRKGDGRDETEIRG